MIKKNICAFRKLSWKEKNDMLVRLTWEFDHTKAIDLLPLELSPFDLGNLPDEALQTYLLFAKMIANNGAEQFALRILKKFKTEIEERRITNPVLLHSIHSAIIGFYGDIGMDEETISYGEKVLKANTTNDSQLERFITYISWKVLFAKLTLGKISTEEFLEQYETIKKQIPQDQKNLNYYESEKVITLIMSSTWPLEKFLKECDELIAQPENHMAPFLLLSKVRILQNSGKLKEAYELCTQIKDEFPPSAFRYYVYYISQLNALCYNTLPFTDSILVRAYPFVDFSLYKDSNKIHGHNLDHDVWHIGNNKIESRKYEDIPSQAPCLDLTAALVALPQGKVELLSPLRTHALKLLIGSSTLGCSPMQLTEKLFMNEQIDFQYLIKRVEDVVSQLMKLGFPIYRKEKRLYFDLENYNNTIILPRTNEASNPIFFLKKNLPAINSKTLCSTLNISRASSWNYIAEWTKEGLIKKDPHQPGKYLFVKKPTSKDVGLQNKN